MTSAPHSAPTTASVPLSELRVVSLPEQELVDHLSARVPGFRYVLRDMAGDPVGARAEELDGALVPLRDPQSGRQPGAGAGGR